MINRRVGKCAPRYTVPAPNITIPRICPPYSPTSIPHPSPATSLPSAAWAAARRAMGTRNGEQET
jgi:hypothetical protein